MSIKNFEQFINESAEVNKERLSRNDIINDAYSKLLNLSRDCFDKNIKKLTLQLNLIDQVIKMIKERFGEHIVGEPEIYIHEIEMDSNNKYYYSEGMYEIDFDFNTDIPFNEDYDPEDYDKDNIDALNEEIKKLFNRDYFDLDGEEDRLYTKGVCFYNYNRNDNMTIKIEIDGIYTSGLINLCRCNNYYKYDLNKIIFRKDN